MPAASTWSVAAVVAEWVVEVAAEEWGAEAAGATVVLAVEEEVSAVVEWAAAVVAEWVAASAAAVTVVEATVVEATVVEAWEAVAAWVAGYMAEVQVPDQPAADIKAAINIQLRVATATVVSGTSALAIAA